MYPSIIKTSTFKRVTQPWAHVFYSHKLFTALLERTQILCLDLKKKYWCVFLHTQTNRITTYNPVLNKEIINAQVQTPSWTREAAGSKAGPSVFGTMGSVLKRWQFIKGCSSRHKGQYSKYKYYRWVFHKDGRSSCSSLSEVLTNF